MKVVVQFWHRICSIGAIIILVFRKCIKVMDTRGKKLVKLWPVSIIVLPLICSFVGSSLVYYIYIREPLEKAGEIHITQSGFMVGPSYRITTYTSHEKITIIHPKIGSPINIILTITLQDKGEVLTNLNYDRETTRRLAGGIGANYVELLIEAVPDGLETITFSPPNGLYNMSIITR